MMGRRPLHQPLARLTKTVAESPLKECVMGRGTKTINRQIGERLVNSASCGGFRSTTSEKWWVGHHDWPDKRPNRTVDPGTAIPVAKSPKSPSRHQAPRACCDGPFATGIAAGQGRHFSNELTSQPGDFHQERFGQFDGRMAVS